MGHVPGGLDRAVIEHPIYGWLLSEIRELGEGRVAFVHPTFTSAQIVIGTEDYVSDRY